MIPSPKTVSQNASETDEFRRWIDIITDLQPLIGSGSPEGIFDAAPGRLFVDQSAASGSVLYVKRDAEISGDRTKGWILV